MSNRSHPAPSRASGAAHPVILFGAEGLEVLGMGPEGERLGRSERAFELAASTAVHAATLVRSIGCEPGPCTMALAASFLSQRLLSLPEVPAKELRAVLQRKAAALLEVAPEEALYSALPLDLEEGAKERKWLMLAVRRSPYLRLRYELRDHGFDVRRVVSERMSLASAAQELIGSGKQDACIVVGMEANATSVHLLHDRQLVHQSVLTTRFEDDAAMAKVLVQELRGFDAFWRRRSRGGNVSRVVLVGIAPRWAERLEFAVHAALTSATIERLEVDGESGVRSARIAALRACRSETAVQISLDLPLAPKRRTVATVAGASALLAAGIAFVSLDGLEAKRERLEAERARLELRAEGHDQLVQQQQLIEDSLDSLAHHRHRIEYVGRYGLPFEAALADVLATVAPYAGLTSIAMSSEGMHAGRVEVGIEVPASPVESQRALDGMLAEAERAQVLAGFVVETPRAASASGQTLRCRAEGRLETAR